MANVPNILKNKLVLIGGAVSVVLIILAISLVGSYNSAQSTGIQKEAEIVSLNNGATIYLNQYAAGLYEQVGIANLKSDKIDQIISDAVKGRYTLSPSASPTDKTALFSLIKEAYPNIDLSIYDKIVNYVQAGRDHYGSLLQIVQDHVRNFVTWRKSGFPHAMFVSMIGLPDNTLRCQNDNSQMLFGQACEDYLLTVSQPNGSNNGGGQGPLTIPTR